MVIPTSTGSRGAGNPQISARAQPSQFGAQAAGALARTANQNQIATGAEVAVTRENRQLINQDRQERGRTIAIALQGADKLAGQLAERMEKDQAIEADKLAGDHRIAMSKHAEEIKAKVPEDGAGYTDALLDKFDAETKSVIDQSRSRYQSDLLNKAFQTRRQQTELSANSYEVQARKAKRAADLQSILDLKEADLAENPALAPQILAEGNASIDGSNLSANKKRRLKRTMQRRFAKVAVESLIATDPTEALSVMENENIRISLGADITALKASAEIALDSGTRVERARRKKLSEEAIKTGYDLISEGKLTPQWLEENRGVLTGTQYRYLSESLRGGVKKTQPSIYGDLIMRSTSEPIKVREEALELFTKGQLTQSDFDRVYRLTNPSGQPMPRWNNALNQFIGANLRPSEFELIEGAGNAATRIQREAMLEFQVWVSEHPQASIQDARKRATDIVENALIERKVNQARLPFGYTGSKFDISDETIRQSISAIQEAVRSGKMDKDEARRHGAVLKIWQDLVKKGLPNAN